ncbi:MAG: LysM peptidoglycan-binding domain-containing protein [Spirochaetaceae bacterium]|jgi:flagellar basal body-associated protein FliL|nr:LysM peptidoglycan-binding domain-containing protein [Spirochaetaceae bacterium]
MAATIGIKIANGEFYSILEESSAVKKRLILTTVHDGQKSVQIDLYKSALKTMADAAYIGSLVVENIKSRPKGEPSIELIISYNAAGELSADVLDLDDPSGSEPQHLVVSLKSLEESARDYDIPDFELDSHEPPPQGLYERAQEAAAKETKKGSLWVLVLVVLLLLLLLGAAAWYFLLKGKTGGKTPAAPPATEAPADSGDQAGGSQPGGSQAVQQPPPRTPPVSAPVIEAPSQSTAQAGRSRTRPPAPVSSYAVPQTIPREGAVYRIRWGDTLWDISEAFYRNPWLYPRIARFNNIRNPDLIISGTTIRIPPKN